MTYLHTIILAIVEGLTEFLPVSSTGHLILTAHLLQLETTEFLKSFELYIQLGAILAIGVLYWQRLLKLWTWWPKLIVAFIPTAFLGFLMYDWIKSVLLESSVVTVISLGVGGLILIGLEFLLKTKPAKTLDLKDLSYFQAVLIGLGQSVSMIPGVSRAAATMMTGLGVGLNRTTAVEFSFLLALPTMAAASGFDLLQSHFTYSPTEWQLLSLGFIVSFIVALVVVKWLVRYVEHHTFIPFGIYRIVAALLFWWLVL